MSFSGSTRVATSRYQPKSSGDVAMGADFTPANMSSAGITTNAGAAADAVSTAGIYKELRDNAPDFQSMTKTAAEARMNERISSMNAEANMAAAGIQAKSAIAQAEEQAKAYEAQASAAKTGGAMSAIGGIASAAIGLFSDEETKHTIDKIEHACDILRELNPVTFFYKEEYSAHPERMHYGFIAQEFQKVMPDATYIDSATGKLCIDTAEVIGLLVRANQELQYRVTKLEARNALTAV